MARANISQLLANGPVTETKPLPSLEKKKPRAASKKSASVSPTTSGLISVKPSRYSVAGVAFVALLVSLKHLCVGVIDIADVPWYEGTAMAIVFDCFLVATEWMLLTCEFTDRWGKAAAESIMVLVVVWSMYLNAMAFSHGHFDFDHLVQIGWGFSLPYLILASVFAATRCK